MESVFNFWDPDPPFNLAKLEKNLEAVMNIGYDLFPNLEMADHNIIHTIIL